MNAIEIKEKLISGGFDAMLTRLYGEAKGAAKRYSIACDESALYLCAFHDFPDQRPSDSKWCIGIGNWIYLV